MGRSAGERGGEVVHPKMSSPAARLSQIGLEFNFPPPCPGRVQVSPPAQTAGPLGALQPFRALNGRFAVWVFLFVFLLQRRFG